MKKVLISLDDDLHKKAKMDAGGQGLTLQDWFTLIIEKYFGIKKEN